MLAPMLLLCEGAYKPLPTSDATFIKKRKYMI